MNTWQKRAASLMLVVLMLLLLIPGSLAEEGSTVSNPVIPGLMLVPLANNNATIHFSPSITNATVAYVHWEGNNTSTDLQSVNGSFDSTYNNAWSTDDDYWVFFVKPNDNCLLTGLGTDGNGNMYSVEGPYGNIGSYPNIGQLAAAAKAQGYVVMFGYKRGSNTASETIAFQVNCQSPDIIVSAVSNKTDNVKPGDNLEFTVTVIPGKAPGKGQVEGMEIVTLEINGEEISVDPKDVIQNQDGSYTVTVPYEATFEDCIKGSVELNVTATVSYSGTYALTDTSGDTGTVNTTASITKSASTICYIAPQSNVKYVLTFDGLTSVEINNYPSEILNIPTDNGQYFEGESVDIDSTVPESSPVMDSINGGKWTFDGWYLNSEKVTESSVKMGDSQLVFTGTWTFTPITKTVTVKKTVDGNMGDVNKDFSFTAVIKRGDDTLDTVSFTLNGSSNAEKELSIPYGATVVITENSDGYAPSYRVDEDANVSHDSCTINSVTDDHTVTFTNTKSVTIDTGVSLDILPYILLLAVVGGAVTLLVVMSRKRRKED